MYNYEKDKNLTKFYKYLKANNLYDQFIKHIVLKDKVYEKMLKSTKEDKKDKKND